MADALRVLKDELIRRFGKSVSVREDGVSLVVQCGNEEASVSISVDDASRPSFAVGYPAFDARAQSRKDLKHLDARGVLVPAILGIVKAVVRDGAVLPELPAPGLRRRARRSAKT